MQIAKMRGAYVIPLTSAANADFVRSLGADEVIDYAATDFTEVVADVDVVLEVIGGDYPAKALEVLKPAESSFQPCPHCVLPNADDAAQRGIRSAGLLVEADRLGMTALADLAADRKLSPTIAATYPLDQVDDAHSAKTGPGKTVIALV